LTYDPNNTTAHLGLGTLYTEQGSYKQAVEQGEKIYAIDPAPVNLLWLAYVHEKMNDHERAIYFLKKQYRRDPSSVSLDQLLPQNPTKEALVSLRLFLMGTARSIKKEKVYADVQLIDNLYVQKKSDTWESLAVIDEISLWEEASSLYPENPDFIGTLGARYSLSRRWQEAEETLQRALFLDPDQKLAKDWLEYTRKAQP